MLFRFKNLQRSFHFISTKGTEKINFPLGFGLKLIFYCKKFLSRKYVWVFIIMSFFLISFSCVKDAPSDFGNPESAWEPGFSLALGYGSLGMNEDSGFNMDLFNDYDLSGFPDWIEEVDIPLTYQFPFDLENLNEFSEEIVTLMFRINTYNGFPAFANVQAYFLDINEIVVDSLFPDEPLIIEPGNLQGNGETVEKKHTQTDVYISQEKIDALSSVRYLLVEGGIQNLQLDTALIDYYPTYTIDIQMGMQAELNLTISNNETNYNPE